MTSNEDWSRPNYVISQPRKSPRVENGRKIRNHQKNPEVPTQVQGPPPPPRQQSVHSISYSPLEPTSFTMTSSPQPVPYTTVPVIPYQQLTTPVVPNSSDPPIQRLQQQDDPTNFVITAGDEYNKCQYKPGGLGGDLCRSPGSGGDMYVNPYGTFNPCACCTTSKRSCLGLAISEFVLVIIYFVWGFLFFHKRLLHKGPYQGKGSNSTLTEQHDEYLFKGFLPLLGVTLGIGLVGSSLLVIAGLKTIKECALIHTAIAFFEFVVLIITLYFFVTSYPLTGVVEDELQRYFFYPAAIVIALTLLVLYAYSGLAAIGLYTFINAGIDPEHGSRRLNY